VILAGVDEAGRGSVLGPLVVAGVAIDETKIPQLVELGVKDSKLLTPQKRRSLFKKIKKLASGVVCQKIFPKEIDEVVFRGERLFRLNYLEAKIMSSILDQIHFDLAFIDCCDTNQLRFGQLVSDLIANRRGWSLNLGEKNPLLEKIVSEHHADRNYPVVAAASIIAKVTRDASIQSLRKIHGEFGSGYPSDHYTISYLKDHYEKSNDFPHFTRLSWITVQRIQGKVVDEEDGALLEKLIESEEQPES
jgi:ribonuclease HII